MKLSTITNSVKSASSSITSKFRKEQKTEEVQVEVTVTVKERVNSMLSRFRKQPVTCDPWNGCICPHYGKNDTKRCQKCIESVIKAQVNEALHTMTGFIQMNSNIK